MLGILKRLIDDNEKHLHKYRAIVEKINGHEDAARALSDDQIKKETDKFKEQIESGTSLDDLLPWAYAIVREAARRTLGMRHYDVQMIAGIAMHYGNVVEQKTGEGKTLTATTSLYLNALTGKGVHLVTVNDYLARRDAGWMGMVYNALGMSTGVIISGASFIFDPKHNEENTNDWRLSHLRPCTKKEAYEADITYGINSEFGFDYLRDNMVQTAKRLVQRNFYYVIVDEADSVLIDEARTPHIISAPYEQDTSKYYHYAKIIRGLNEETDFVIDEKMKTAHLSEEGIMKVEKMLGLDNIYEQDFETLYHVEAALKAKALFKKEKDYIVQGGEVVIVDEFTGRLLQGRRFSEGLHQAIEAKENVEIKQESKTLATVSLQNYFRMYEKLAGMTGTASTEAEEFQKIYKAQVVVVPTHRSLQREDAADEIYKTIKAKYQAIAEEVAREHKKGRPILIGTTSIDKNEYLSKLLHKLNVPHEMLNAKNHEREAQIIAKAGTKGAITVATNMAGRGVDIVLGGMEPVKSEMSEETYQKAITEWRKQHDEIIELGGLYVIGTERHESRRIDNQLRGRSGRQGDPGKSKFYVALEDDLMRIFGGEQISRLMNFFNLPEDQPLSHPMVSKSIEQAQVKVEGFNFDVRKRLVEYDDVLNRQREIYYDLRRSFLLLPEDNPEEFMAAVSSQFEEVIQQLTTNYFAIHGMSETDEEMSEDTEHLVKDFEVIFPGELPKLREMMKSETLSQEELTSFLVKKAQSIYQDKQQQTGVDVWQRVVRGLFLSTVDTNWTKHLTAIDDLREGINLRGYAQLDPLVEYKNEAYRLFEELISTIKYEFTRRVLHVEIRKEDPAHSKEERSKEPEQTMYFQPATGQNTLSQPTQYEVPQQGVSGSTQSSEDQSTSDVQSSDKRIATKHSNTSKKKKRKKRNRK